MTRHLLRLQTELLVAAVAFVALFMICYGAPRTACPRKIGFDAVPDKIAFNSHKGYYGASQPVEAGTMCASEAACVAFDTLGIRHFMELGRLVDNPGVCTYIKLACPKAAGYQTLVNKRWDVAAAGGNNTSAAAAVSTTHGSAAAAKAYCNSTLSCLGWNNKGDTLTLAPPAATSSSSPSSSAGAAAGGEAAAVAAGVSFPGASEAICTYLKDPCPPRFGYTTKKDVRCVLPAAAVNGVKAGRMGSAAEAEEFCKANAKCTAWNTAAQVVIGGIQSYEPAAGECLYVKQPCLAVPGFTAHDGVTIPGSPGRQNPANTSFTDLVAQCTLDPHCTAFDMLRRTWSVGSSKEPTVPFHGMCTFVKVAGLI